MTIKKILFIVITGLIVSITHTTNIEFYDSDSNSTEMYIRRPGVRCKGPLPTIKYHNDAIIVIKNMDKISAHYIGDLQSIQNAFLTNCSNFDVIEHGANTKNQNLCNDIAIIQAYEQFRKTQK